MTQYRVLKKERDEAIEAAVEARRLSMVEEVDRIRAECELEKEELREEIYRLNALISTPMIEDFMRAVPLEAAHQLIRYGSEHDAGKEQTDWYWLLGYLGGKIVHAMNDGNIGKALHHTISSAAVLLNWHAHLLGKSDGVQPGILPPAEVTNGTTSDSV